MTIQPATYTELTATMFGAMLSRELSVGHVALLLSSCAQETTTENSLNVVRELRERLTDWTNTDKGRVIAIEIVQVEFVCQSEHPKSGKEPGHTHCLQMTRVICMPGFNPQDVMSSCKFDELVYDITAKHHPHQADLDTAIRLRGIGFNRNSLASVFGDWITGETDNIDNEVDAFRAELDKLFSTPGKEEGDGTEGPATG